MKPTRIILLYVAGLLLVSALAAPWVFWATQAAGGWLSTVPFRRVFNRVLLVTAALGLWPVLRAVGIRSWQAVGYVPTRRWGGQVLVGLGLGVFSYALAGVLAGPAWQWPGTPGKLAGFMFSAVAVALVEETFFRGGMQNLLQRQMRVPVAVMVVSGIYSVVHFLKPAGAHIPAGAVVWSSGFEYLGRVVATSFEAPGVWIGVVSLWLAGGVLGWAFARTRALYLSLGLHAGWVLALKTVAWLGGGSVVENVLIWPVLALLLVGVEWLSRCKLMSAD